MVTHVVSPKGTPLKALLSHWGLYIACCARRRCRHTGGQHQRLARTMTSQSRRSRRRCWWSCGGRNGETQCVTRLFKTSRCIVFQWRSQRFKFWVLGWAKSATPIGNHMLNKQVGAQQFKIRGFTIQTNRINRTRDKRWLSNYGSWNIGYTSKIN